MFTTNIELNKKNPLRFKRNGTELNKNKNIPVILQYEFKPNNISQDPVDVDRLVNYNLIIR